MGGVYHRLGMILGVGPLLLVLLGLLPDAQSWFGPQPMLPPFTIRFSSSLQLGPFSVSHRRPVRGSKANPNELRIPKAQIRRFLVVLLMNGLPGAALPDGVMRRILPAELRRFWALAVE